MAKAAKRKQHGDGKRLTMAEQADRHLLYEQSVQNVDDEVIFLRETFEAVRGRPASMLREDFCGTGAAAAAWVKDRDHQRAVGVDIDQEVLAWGRRHRVEPLPADARGRVKLVEANVLDVDVRECDLITAFNFSYWIFKTRADMLRYFRNVRASLVDDGVFMLDAYGGPDAYEECKEKTKLKGFTYVWEQADFDPISGQATCYIHFKFRDGSRLKRAFTYRWRVWTLPELRELLEEAGFSRSVVYWQGADDDGEADGEFAPAEVGENDPAWIAYIVAEK